MYPVDKLADDKTDTDTDTGTSTENKDEPDGKTETDTETDEKKPLGTELKFPEFCEWAKWICDDKTKPDKDTEIEPKELEIDFTSIAEKSYISFPKSCPSNPRFSFSMPIAEQSFTLEFPLHVFCQAFGLFKFVVILFGYIKALSIIGSS